MSFNTWNCQGNLHSRLPLMISELETLNPDLVLLQEVFNELPSGLNVATEMALALNLNAAFVPARTKMRTFEGNDVPCQSGLAILSKGDISESEITSLPQDERDGERVAQIIHSEIHGQKLMVANVHLSHLKNEDSLRQKQLYTLMGKFNGDLCDLFILGGDMNLPVGHPVLKELEKDNCFVVASDNLSSTETTSLNPVGGMEVTSGIIDHLFIKSKEITFKVIETRMGLAKQDGETGLFPSDHKALIADLGFE